MYTTSHQWLYMSYRPSPLQRKHSLGRRWTKTLFRSWRFISAFSMGFPCWRRSTGRTLAWCAVQPQIYTAQSQFGCCLWQSLLDSSRHWLKLLGLGYRMLHLQLRDQESQAGVVEKIQHDTQCRFGFRCCCRCGGDILWYCVPGLDERVQVVGDGSVQAGKSHRASHYKSRIMC